MLTDVFCNFKPSSALTFIYIFCRFPISVIHWGSLVHYKAVICKTGAFSPKLFPWLNPVYYTWKLKSTAFYIPPHLRVTPCSDTNCDLLVLLLTCPLSDAITSSKRLLIVGSSSSFLWPHLYSKASCHLASKTLYGNPNPWNLLGAVNVRLTVGNAAIYWSVCEC